MWSRRYLDRGTSINWHRLTAFDQFPYSHLTEQTGDTALRMRGKNLATPKGTQKKSGSPGPSKAKDRQGKGVSQKGPIVTDKKKPEADDVPVCEDCSIPIGVNVSALQCDSCDSNKAWKCTSCLGMSEELYQELITNADQRVIQIERKIEESINESHSRIIGLQCESKVATRMDRVLEDEDWPRLGCSYTGNPVDEGKVKEIIKEAVNQQQEEEKEVEARRNNLVLYNIPENQSERHEDRLKADRDFIATMCDDVAGFEIKDADIVKCIRLGAFSVDKTRPLLITLSSKETRDGILRMGKDLGLSGRRYSCVGIAPDLTRNYWRR